MNKNRGNSTQKQISLNIPLITYVIKLISIRNIVISPVILQEYEI